MIVTNVGLAWESISKVLEVLSECGFFHEKCITMIKTRVAYVIGDIQTYKSEICIYPDKQSIKILSSVSELTLWLTEQTEIDLLFYRFFWAHVHSRPRASQTAHNTLPTLGSFCASRIIATVMPLQHTNMAPFPNHATKNLISILN